VNATLSPQVPASPTALYKTRREAGDDHAKAVRQVAHSYRRRPKELEPILVRARNEMDRPEPEAVEPPQETPEPHPLAAVEVEIRARLDSLSALRQTLALDALGDKAKAEELAGVEADLAGAHAELERVPLARREAEIRERAEREQAEAAAREPLLRRARLLQAKREASARRVDGAFKSAAEALAQHHAIVAEQTHTLTAAGDSDAWRAATQPWMVACAFAVALRQAGVQAEWFDPDTAMIGHAAPLAELDFRPIEPARK
jgi:hypothetical protein